jgi:hypothetical protein
LFYQDKIIGLSAQEEKKKNNSKESRQLIILTNNNNKEEDELYQNFVNSLQSEYTQRNYKNSLLNFLFFLQMKDNGYTQLLKYDIKTTETLVRDYILNMKRINLSLSTINCYYAAIK